ncbi:MAG TPA: acyl-CoA-binding protein [Candidatus Hydrogenedentes bacterium]|nr:acyl-CoA-binding protein [Candidatus Hydrogenedentota bacterium]HRK36424.1 acyl-CoA-binding protein [Candidatus Hydrogenedentota bacterium]
MSDDLLARFEQAAKDITTMSEPPDNEAMLKLYGLYKQSTKGDCTGARPGLLDFVGRAKYDAWKAIEGISLDEAKQKYIDYVAELVAKDKAK